VHRGAESLGRRIRAHPQLARPLSDHARTRVSEFERIVEENEEYIIVEKFGEAAEVAKSLDPRSHSQ
jgi:hypothetical protein